MKFIDFEKSTEITDIESVIAAFQAGEIKSGDEIKVRGSILKIKEMSGFAFINVRGQRAVFQCIWDENSVGKHCDCIEGVGQAADESKCTEITLKDFSAEECVIIKGKLVEEERSKVGFDVMIKEMTRVSGKAAVLPVEISSDKKIDKLTLNTLLDNRIITLRNPKVRAITRIADGVMYAFRDFLRQEGFVEFVPPKMVQSGAEGGADMFEVDYFGQKAYLNQSPQMYKQVMVGVFQKAFTVGPVFRAEKYSTNRHINEFQGLDLEMGYIDSFYDLITLETRMMRHMFKTLNEEYAVELEQVLGKGARLPEITQCPVIKFIDAKKLYAEAHPGKEGQKALLEPDFAPDEEKWLGEYFNKEYNSPIVFVTHYPSVKRPFYAMDDPEDARFTLSYDMLLNGLEVTTGGQRIHDYEAQIAKMKKRGMDVEEFEDYLTMHKYGMPPHGGMGLGMERVVQNLLGLDTIKQATAFPRDRDRIRP